MVRSRYVDVSSGEESRSAISTRHALAVSERRAAGPDATGTSRDHRSRLPSHRHSAAGLRAAARITRVDAADRSVPRFGDVVRPDAIDGVRALPDGGEPRRSCGTRRHRKTVTRPVPARGATSAPDIATFPCSCRRPHLTWIPTRRTITAKGMVAGHVVAKSHRQAARMDEVAAAPLRRYVVREPVEHLPTVSSDDGGSVRKQCRQAREPLTADRKGVDIQRDNGSCPRVATRDPAPHRVLR